MLAVPVIEPMEMVRLDFVPPVVRVKGLRSIAYSCPAAMLITLNVVHPEALEAVQNVTDATGTFGLTLVTVPAVAVATVVHERDTVATQATEQYTVAPTGAGPPSGLAIGKNTVVWSVAGCCSVAAVVEAVRDTLPVVAM